MNLTTLGEIVYKFPASGGSQLRGFYWAFFFLVEKSLFATWKISPVFGYARVVSYVCVQFVPPPSSLFTSDGDWDWIPLKTRQSCGKSRDRIDGFGRQFLGMYAFILATHVVTSDGDWDWKCFENIIPIFWENLEIGLLAVSAADL